MVITQRLQRLFIGGIHRSYGGIVDENVQCVRVYFVARRRQTLARTLSIHYIYNLLSPPSLSLSRRVYRLAAAAVQPRGTRWERPKLRLIHRIRHIRRRAFDTTSPCVRKKKLNYALIYGYGKVIRNGIHRINGKRERK